MRRAIAAILLMQSEEAEINFRSVALLCASLDGLAIPEVKTIPSRDRKTRAIIRLLPPVKTLNIVSGSRMNVLWQLCDSASRHWRSVIVS